MPIASKGLKIGQSIPLFKLPNVQGEEVSIKLLIGRPFLLYFLRGTWCPNCRKQLSQLKEKAQVFNDLDIPVLVIVGQKKEAVERWLEKNPMPFPFLIDETRDVIKAFNVYHPFGIDAYKIAHPSTFLIDQEGQVAFAYVGKHQADRPSFESTYNEIVNLLDDTFNNPSV
jgi:peroxiredoxin